MWLTSVQLKYIPMNLVRIRQDVLLEVAPTGILSLAERDKEALDLWPEEMAGIVMAPANMTVVVERGRTQAPRYHLSLRLHRLYQTFSWGDIGLK